MCRNWQAAGRCSYGNKCRFAHGEQDVKDRSRSETYNTKATHISHRSRSLPAPSIAAPLTRSCLYGVPLYQPCTDLARDGSRTCTYGKRCNYAHPGDSIRRVSTGIKLATASSSSSSQAAVGEAADGGYMDAQYVAWTAHKYPIHAHPFGIFM